ncbi:MAG: hypothetical protein IJI22_00030 [Bacilli bacterium]|nr:hypothetical protein [Bacilli bacterium]
MATESLAPAELIRQSTRVDEQVEKLGIMLNKINGNLDEVSKIMTNYDTKLVSQVENLKTAVESYKKKATNIYGEMSKSLYAYATGLQSNLADLTKNVTTITSSVEAL